MSTEAAAASPPSRAWTLHYTAEATVVTQRQDRRWYARVLINGDRKDFFGSTAAQARLKRDRWLALPQELQLRDLCLPLHYWSLDRSQHVCIWPDGVVEHVPVDSLEFHSIDRVVAVPRSPVASAVGGRDHRSSTPPTHAVCDQRQHHDT